MYEDITRKISIDDFVRVLPAGKSQIVKKLIQEIYKKKKLLIAEFD